MSRAFITPLIYQYHQTSLISPSYFNVRNGARFLTVLECTRECKIYADDSQTKLITHLTYGAFGTFEIYSPTEQIVIVWIGAAVDYMASDTVLFSYLSWAELSWDLTAGTAKTLFRQWLNFGAPPPPFLTVNMPMDTGFHNALGFMVDPSAIPVETEFVAHALTSASIDNLDRDQLLAIMPYILSGGIPTPWDGATVVSGSVTVTGDVTVIEPHAEYWISTTGNVSTAFTAGTATPILSIYNPAASGRTLRVWAIDIYIESASAATDANIQVLRPNGVPAAGSVESRVTYDSANMISVADVRSLPTIATTGSSLARQRYSLGITGASPTTKPPSVDEYVPMLHELMSGYQPSGIVLRDSEGAVLRLTSTNNSTIQWGARVLWTEE